MEIRCFFRSESLQLFRQLKAEVSVFWLVGWLWLLWSIMGAGDIDPEWRVPSGRGFILRKPNLYLHMKIQGSTAELQTISLAGAIRFKLNAIRLPASRAEHLGHW